MAMVLNTSARSIYTQISVENNKKVKVVKRFAFHPAQLTQVEDKDWDELLKQDFISECVDNEELETGGRAKKKSANLEKDVTNADNKAKKQGKEEADK